MVFSFFFFLVSFCFVLREGEKKENEKKQKEKRKNLHYNSHTLHSHLLQTLFIPFYLFLLNLIINWKPVHKLEPL